MKMFFILTFLGLFFLGHQSNFVLEKELGINADFITVDQMGFLYLSNNSEITKIDLERNKKEHYSNKINGRINTIDISDPFKTLIFHKEFNKVEFLNKDFTSIASPIQLDDLGYFDVLSACQSVNGGFWIFDQSLSQLLYIDKNRNTVKSSAQIPDLTGQNIAEKQVYMLEKNDYIYLGIHGLGILYFDSYGSYIKTFPLINARFFQVNNDVISYDYNGELYFYNTANYTESQMSIPEHETKQVVVEKEKLFIRTKDKIYIYRLNN